MLSWRIQVNGRDLLFVECVRCAFHRFRFLHFRSIPRFFWTITDGMCIVHHEIVAQAIVLPAIEQHNNKQTINWMYQDGELSIVITVHSCAPNSVHSFTNSIHIDINNVCFRFDFKCSIRAFFVTNSSVLFCRVIHFWRKYKPLSLFS